MNHAMVRVYANETYYIECTRKRIVADIPAGYTGVDEYKDVVAAVQQSGYKPLEWVGGCNMYSGIGKKKREGHSAEKIMMRRVGQNGI